MTKQLRVITILLILSILLSGCGKITIDKQSKTDNNNLNITGTEIPTTNPTQVPKFNEDKEIFYGTWIISKIITSGNASIYSQDDIDKLMGKKLEYNSNYVRFENNIQNNPYYKKETISESDFLIGYTVSFKDLGIENKSIVQVEVYTDDACTNYWDSIGSTILIKNDNTLILIDGGDFFELTKE